MLEACRSDTAEDRREIEERFDREKRRLEDEASRFREETRSLRQQMQEDEINSSRLRKAPSYASALTSDISIDHSEVAAELREAQVALLALDKERSASLRASEERLESLSEEFSKCIQQLSTSEL